VLAPLAVVFISLVLIGVTSFFLVLKFAFY
jgi:hypothetical protein